MPASKEYIRNNKKISYRCVLCVHIASHGPLRFVEKGKESISTIIWAYVPVTQSLNNHLQKLQKFVFVKNFFITAYLRHRYRIIFAIPLCNRIMTPMGKELYEAMRFLIWNGSEILRYKLFISRAFISSFVKCISL